MKNTKDQIIIIAKKVMNDIDWSYDYDKDLGLFFTTENEQFEKYKNFEGFEEHKHKFFAYWTVGFEFPKEESWKGRNTYFICIKDDDREPYKISHRQAKFKLIKDTDGKYKTEQF